MSLVIMTRLIIGSAVGQVSESQHPVVQANVQIFEHFV
jgi:hypothetical protein